MIVGRNNMTSVSSASLYLAAVVTNHALIALLQMWILRGSIYSEAAGRAIRSNAACLLGSIIALLVVLVARIGLASAPAPARAARLGSISGHDARRVLLVGLWLLIVFGIAFFLAASSGISCQLSYSNPSIHIVELDRLTDRITVGLWYCALGLNCVIGAIRIWMISR